MRRLHLFNPENDGALVTNNANYTPPAAARQMHTSGEALPVWYADAGDRFVSYGTNARWLDAVRTRMNIDVDAASDAEIASGTFEAAPWGWSTNARALFQGVGYPAAYLPDDSQLARWRTLSSRSLTVDFNRVLHEDYDLYAPMPRIITDVAELRLLIEHPGYLKQPWSSSGRGVVATDTLTVDEALRRADGVIRRQGMVMWEPAHKRIIDFAMLFDCRNGHVCFLGLSLFSTDNSGRYAGNILATQQYISGTINLHLPQGTLARVRAAVADTLTRLVAPDYTGIVGVDMMVVANGEDSAAVVPCVEINLRKTMGYVALCFAERHLADGVCGLLSVAPSGAISQATSPLGDCVLDDSGRLVAGTLLLSPPAQFAFTAQILQ